MGRYALVWRPITGNSCWCFLPLSQWHLAEDGIHGLGIHRVGVYQIKAFHHVQCALFVGLEVRGGNVVFVGVLVGVNLNNAHLAGVALLGHGEDGNHAGLFSG